MKPNSKYNKQWRKDHPKIYREQKNRCNYRYRLGYPRRHHAAQVIYRAIVKGKLKKQSCEVCGSNLYLQCHPMDLSRDPLIKNNHVWLCCDCSKKFHNAIKHKRNVKKIVKLEI